jgi:hypothetical protein
MFESICWSTLGCHSGSLVFNLCLCVISETCFVMSAWNTVLVQTLLVTHSRNSHYFSEVESSVLYNNFEVHCLALNFYVVHVALNSFFVFKNTLWSYHALPSVYTGLSEVVLSLGLCVQDSCIISTKMFLFLEILLSMSWSKQSFPVSCVTLVLFPVLP